VIRRRFQAGRENLEQRYISLVDHWSVFHNLDSTGPVLIDQGDTFSLSLQPSLFSDREEITRRFCLGVREVLRDHQWANNPVAVWRQNGLLVALPEKLD